ncbi:MAG TPA: response regulator [Tepidisphaeraceae bacterium]|nr:response regulator [Tepidisphaeraceae bacterium]
MRTVLVLEQNPRYRKMLATALEFAGHRPVCTNDADEAIDVLRSGPVDLMLVQIKAGGFDGIGFLKRVRAEVALRVLPIIVMTETDDRDGVLMASQLGIQELLVRRKVPLAKVLAFVRQHLHRPITCEGTLMGYEGVDPQLAVV